MSKLPGPQFFIRDATRRAVPVGVEEWAKQFEWDGSGSLTNQRHVALTKVGTAIVSTVFVGVSMRRMLDEGEPLLFETMIFGGPHDNYQVWCSTWRQAEAQHADAVAMATDAERDRCA